MMLRRPTVPAVLSATLGALGVRRKRSAPPTPIPVPRPPAPFPPPPPIPVPIPIPVPVPARRYVPVLSLPALAGCLALGLFAGLVVGRPAAAQGCVAEICQDFAVECATGHEYASLTISNDDPEEREVRVRFRWRQDGVTEPWSDWLTLVAGEDFSLSRCDVPAGADIQRLEVDGLIPGQPTLPVDLTADPPENRCAEVACGGGMRGGSVDLPAQCRSPRPFELATVSLASRASVPIRVSYYWRVDGANLESTVKLDPGAQALLASCDVAGAGRDVQVFAITAVCRMDSGGRRCQAPADPGAWAILGHQDLCAAAACAVSDSPACDKLVPMAALPGTGQAEKGRVIVYQEAKKPGRQYPTVRFSAHWLVRRGDQTLLYPACTVDFSECGNISFKERRAILADFIVPVSDDATCDGEVDDLVGLCLAPATDKRAGYKNFARLAGTATSNWLLPCGPVALAQP